MSINVSYSIRIKLMIALILLVILKAGLGRLEDAYNSFRTIGAMDIISKYEQRFFGVSQLLAPGEVVMYIDEAKAGFMMKHGAKPYVLAQYALAPTLLYYPQWDAPIEYVGKPRLVLENLHDPKLEPYLLELLPKYFEQTKEVSGSSGYEISPNQLVRDFGVGVKLYAREVK